MKTKPSKPNRKLKCQVPKPRPGILTTVMLLLLPFALSAHAALRYVDANSASPSPPYTNWATAARVIQDAVDAAAPGEEVVVTNGLYATGGRAVGTNLLVNRVAVDKPLTLRSVNGPEVTIIRGYQVPGTTNGDSAIRCMYLADGARLSGFTLTNGATRAEGNSIHDDSGGGVRCDSVSATVSNCVIVCCSASVWGGGVYSGTLHNCTLRGNSALWGGGACLGTLNNCRLNANSAGCGGGGATGNWLNNLRCMLNDCLLTDNSADIGGGAFECVDLSNCTLTGNSANSGGGVGTAAFGTSTLTNCIVYFNTARDRGDNYGGDVQFSHCCTTPLPDSWGNVIGNITNAPLFVDAAAGNYRLRPDSPCIDAGTNLSAVVTNDLDGRPRPVDGNGDGVAAFDIGAYEYRALLVSQENPNATPPYATRAAAAHVIQDAVDAALPGDEVVVTNGLYSTGGRTVGTNLLANRVAVDKPLTLRSVNGPEVTIIRGYQVPGTTNGDGAIRCVYLANGASLSGFTLSNGATLSPKVWEPGVWSPDHSGGGVWCESGSAAVSNCIVVGNSAIWSGGGAEGGTLNYCTLATNYAIAGGGVYESSLNRCALTGNSAWDGGGAESSTLNNCTLIGNSAGSGGRIRRRWCWREHFEQLHSDRQLGLRSRRRGGWSAR